MARRAAGVGAAGILGLILLLTAVMSAIRLARHRRYDVPPVEVLHAHVKARGAAAGSRS